MVRFTVRMPESVHAKIKELAEQEGVSMNQYIVYALARQAWDPEGTGQIQLAPPIQEQRRQVHEFLADMPRLSDEERRRIIAERQAAREQAKQREKEDETVPG